MGDKRKSRGRRGKVYSTYLNPQLIKILEEKAKKEKRSVSYIINEILENTLLLSTDEERGFNLLKDQINFPEDKSINVGDNF